MALVRLRSAAEAVLAFALTLAACTPSSELPRRGAPPAIEGALGGPAELVVVGHLGAALTDPTWKIPRASIERDIESIASTDEARRAFAKLDDFELYVVLSRPPRVVAVLRDVPSELRPSHLRGRGGAPAYVNDRALVSGVHELDPGPGERGHLFVLPSGTWIFADDRSTLALEGILAASAETPPRPPFGADGLVSAYLAPALFDRARERGYLRETSPSEGALLDLRSGGRVSLKVRFASEPLAQGAEGEARAVAAEKLPGVPVAVERDGTTVSLSLTVPQEK